MIPNISEWKRIQATDILGLLIKREKGSRNISTSLILTVGVKDSEIESEQTPLVDSMKNDNPEDIFREPLKRRLDFSQDMREGIKNKNKQRNQST